jgi:hypothetical protein
VEEDGEEREGKGKIGDREKEMKMGREGPPAGSPTHPLKHEKPVV